MDNVKPVPREIVDIGHTLEMRERADPAAHHPALGGAGDLGFVADQLGWAWTWVVLAELVAATTGLGYRITVAQRYFQTDTIIGYCWCWASSGWPPTRP